MKIQHFFDKATFTLTYVVYDQETKTGIIIDSVTDFDPNSGNTRNDSNDRVATFIDEQNLKIPYVLDTHAHADHFTGLEYFKKRYGCKTVIGKYITSVQATFREVFNLSEKFKTDGSQFDVLLEEGESLEAGPLHIKAIHTPGHTPACLTYHIGDALFAGDAIFMPDYGTGRCDFPGGSGERLYDSIQKLYALPDETRLFTCHDYLPGGRELRYQSTIGEEKQSNIQLKDSTTKEDYVTFRQDRDAGLAMPKLILPALQMNIRAGHFPEPEENGISYLKIPLNQF
ncbi:MAG: MBL fold metallo-hydrolase [Desulfobacterales bacterium]|nr:MBL fold metallo-hydrolase [Desulfobacterales bacterium]